MKAKIAPYIAGYQRVVVMIQIGGKWTCLDWIALDANAEYDKI